MDATRRNEIHQLWAFASFFFFFFYWKVCSRHAEVALRKAINTLSVIHKLPLQHGFKSVDHLSSFDVSNEELTVCFSSV